MNFLMQIHFLLQNHNLINYSKITTSTAVHIFDKSIANDSINRNLLQMWKKLINLPILGQNRSALDLGKIVQR